MKFQHIVTAVFLLMFHSSIFALGNKDVLENRVPAMEESLPDRQPARSVSISQNGPETTGIQLEVFGQQLFHGQFSKDSFTGFNPYYSINIGDKITLKMWGAFNFEKELIVDAQGNIFVPSVGPVSVVGVRNSELDQLVTARIKRVYKSNVQSYINLASAQPVKIFVSGFVNYPGMYAGVSSDSILNFLDQAGGINPANGSYINISLKRNNQTISTINLYDYMLNGILSWVQLRDGDTVHVNPRRNTVTVKGLVNSSNIFEFTPNSIGVLEALDLSHPQPDATHVRVTRSTGVYQNVEYYKIEETNQVSLLDGDIVEVTADKRPGTITVRVEGEHGSEQEHVLPYGSRLRDLVSRITTTPISDLSSSSLFRVSVKKRQKEMLEQSLRSLENAVLTARSATSGEVAIRKNEAELVLQWIAKAKNIQPKGQVVLGGIDSASEVLLENGDILRIPTENSLVTVSGEVLFPTALVYIPGTALNEYIDSAGGYVQNEKSSRIVVMHKDGTLSKVKKKSLFSSQRVDVNAGDEILVLPKVDLKRLQITKDFTQILYQIAVAAGVVLAL